MKRNQHVVPKGDDWAVRREGSDKVTIVVRTQEQAIRIARDIAKNQQSELVIHRPNGQIRERYSYAND